MKLLLYGKKSGAYKPRAQCLRQELLKIKQAGLGHLTLVADSWFADKKLFEWLDQEGFDFEIEITCNHKATYWNQKELGTMGKKGKMVYPSISDIASTLKRNTTFSGRAPKQIAGGVVRLYGSTLRLKLACVWNQNDKSSDKPFAYYVSNNTKRCLSRIWAFSRFRWGIEVCFRNAKQDFSFDAFPFENGRMAFAFTVLGLFLISALEIQRFAQDAKPLAPQQRNKTYESLGSFVKKIRHKTEQDSIRAVLVFPQKNRHSINIFSPD